MTYTMLFEFFNILLHVCRSQLTLKFFSQFLKTIEIHYIIYEEITPTNSSNNCLYLFVLHVRSMYNKVEKC